MLCCSCLFLVRLRWTSFASGGTQDTCYLLQLCRNFYTPLQRQIAELACSLQEPFDSSLVWPGGVTSWPHHACICAGHILYASSIFLAYTTTSENNVPYAHSAWVYMCYIAVLPASDRNWKRLIAKIQPKIVNFVVLDGYFFFFETAARTGAMAISKHLFLSRRGPRPLLCLCRSSSPSH